MACSLYLEFSKSDSERSLFAWDKVHTVATTVSLPVEVLKTIDILLTVSRMSAFSLSSTYS